MFTQLRRDITVRSRRLHQEVARARVQHRRARDEYHLAKAERPRYAARLADLVARYNGVSLYRDRIERGGQTHSLAGVRASVSESRSQHTDLGTVRDVYLTITGPGWEWSIQTAAVFSSRKVRGFAAMVNSYAASASPPAPRTATSSGQFRVLDELRGTGVLTDAEFSTAIERLRGTAQV